MISRAGLDRTGARDVPAFDKFPVLAAETSLELGEQSSADKAIVEAVRQRLGLPSERTTRLLLHLTGKPDQVHSPAVLNKMLGVCSPGSQVLKVYVCLLRGALANLGLADVVHNEWGAGYRIAEKDIVRIQRAWTCSSGKSSERDHSSSRH